MTAASLAKMFEKSDCEIKLVESDQIGTVGVGEATIPHIRFFNQTLGIDENEFMQKTNATYKIGIQHNNWGKKGDSYIHPFGGFGHPINNIPFHHFWLKQYLAGTVTSIEDYSLPIVAAKLNKFEHPHNDPRSMLSTYSYAFHLDASLYARFLREYSEQKKVERIEGKVSDATLHENGEHSGFIKEIVLENGDKIAGDLFIDCSGFRGLLIEQTLKTGYTDWSHWLPCNRAVAVPTEHNGEELHPYTKATAHQAGWQWQIPLQHRTGNGHVYCSNYISDDEAQGVLIANLDGKPLTEPKLLNFKTGHRNQAWNKNCVAIGLSGGFLEPLESTSIYLIQIAITKLLELFPDKHFNQNLINEYNSEMFLEIERVRDFLILHYHATERNDSDFWNYVRTMEIPESLKEKMDLFRQQGYVVPYEKGLFLQPSWVAVYLGQGIIPKTYDIRVDNFNTTELKEYFTRMQKDMAVAANKMQTHAQAIKSNNPYPAATMSLYGKS